MSDILEVADAIVTELNTEVWTPTFTAVRLFLPIFDLKQMNTLHVSVVPKDQKTDRLSRTAVMQTFGLDVGIQKRFSIEESSEIENLVILVNQIVTFFQGRKLASVANSTVLASDPNPIYAQEHMSNFRQFTSVVNLSVNVFP
jgi:hypothetical protein